MVGAAPHGGAADGGGDGAAPHRIGGHAARARRSGGRRQPRRASDRARAARDEQPPGAGAVMSAMPRATLAEDLVRKLASAFRGAQLYARNHPLVQRNIAALHDAIGVFLATAPSIAIGIVG